MQNTKLMRVSFGLLAVFMLTISGCQGNAGIKDHVAISKEAEAMRSGAEYNWDMDTIRERLENRSENIQYTKADKDVVMVVPTSKQLKGKSTDELFELCRHWNPSMGSAVGTELGRRSMSIYDEIVKRSANSDPAIRAACGQVIAGMLSSAKSSGRNSETARFVTKKTDSICKTITALIRDKNVLVRRNTLRAYGAAGLLRGNVSGLANAAMEQAAVETDGHLCQEIIVATFKNRWDSKLDKKTRAERLSKILLQQPFPRGRGTVVKMISKLEPAEIEETMPALLEHYRTPLLRDTMFFPGGTPQAFVLLAKYRKSNPEIFAKALAHADTFNRQPWVSFGGKHAKSMRPYGEAIAEQGSKAACVLPSLELIKIKTQKQLEEAIKEKKSSPQQKIQETLDYTNSIIERISK
jgi:hypothetical protein